MEVGLYKYMEMSTEFSGNAPFVLIGTGALIILIGSLACCCTVKGQPVLLYVVSHYGLAYLKFHFYRVLFSTVAFWPSSSSWNWEQESRFTLIALN